jgi:hypothetical protein
MSRPARGEACCIAVSPGLLPGTRLPGSIGREHSCPGGLQGTRSDHHDHTQGGRRCPHIETTGFGQPRRARSPETTFCLGVHFVLGVGDGMVPTQFDEALV